MFIGLVVWIILVVVWALLIMILVGDTPGLRELSDLLFDPDSDIWLTIHLRSGERERERERGTGLWGAVCAPCPRPVLKV